MARHRAQRGAPRRLRGRHRAPVLARRAAAARARAAARRAGRGRPLHRRRRVHRALGGAPREGRRPRPRRRRARGGHGRLRRERAQRRLRARLADARDRERPRALRRGDAAAGAARPRELPGLRRRHRAPRHRLRPRADRRPRRRARARTSCAWIEETAELLERFGHEYEVFDREAVQAEVASPTYLGGIWEKTDAALVDPGKLVAGLAAAARAAGVRIHERTPATRIVDDGAGDACGHAGRPRPRAARPAGDERLPAAPAGDPPLRRAGLRLRARDGAALAGAARVDRLEAAPGRRRHGEPVPLLPADGRLAHPLGRLRRGVPLRRARAAGAGRRRGDLRDAVAALLHDVPAARGRALHAPLGRRHRHVQPLLGLLRDRARRPGRVRGRLHGARRRLDALRRPRRARPARRPRDRGDPAALRPLEAGAVPAGAAALGRDPADAEPARRGRPKRTVGAASGCARSTGWA